MDDNKRIFQLILELTKQVKTYLSRNEVDAAKKEINVLISDCEKQLQKYVGKNVSDKIPTELYEVITGLKRALMLLDSNSITDEIKSLIDNLILVEKNIVSTNTNFEQKRNELYKYWYNKFFKADYYFYHGTTTLVEARIRRFGLVPGMFPWDPYDIKKLDQLLKKSGYSTGVNERFINSEGKFMKRIYVTPSRDTAIGHAKEKPEILYLISDRTDNYDDAVFSIYKKLTEHWSLVNHVNDKQSDLEILFREFSANSKLWNDYVLKACPLTKGEINEVFSIFRKFWNLVKEHKPLVLTISGRASALQERIPQEFINFDWCLKVTEEYITTESVQDLIKRIEGIHEEIMSIFTRRYEEVVTERIPAQYIIRYEHI